MEKLTKARYAMDVASLVQVAARESADLARGMWNPDFCRSDATHDAGRFIDEMRARLDHLERLVASPPAGLDAISGKGG